MTSGDGRQSRISGCGNKGRREQLRRRPRLGAWAGSRSRLDQMPPETPVFVAGRPAKSRDVSSLNPPAPAPWANSSHRRCSRPSTVVERATRTTASERRGRSEVRHREARNPSSAPTPAPPRTTTAPAAGPGSQSWPPHRPAATDTPIPVPIAVPMSTFVLRLSPRLGGGEVWPRRLAFGLKREADLGRLFG